MSVEGPVNNGRLLHMLCRLTQTGPLIIITGCEKESLG
jgi:hypothetical protein